MTNKEKMLSGLLYIANDPELNELHDKAASFMDEFNSTKYSEFEKRSELAKAIFKKSGKNLMMNKPFHCDYGCNIEIGDNFYSNFNLTLLDVNTIKIGNNVFCAPNVSIYTAGHPIDKDIRNENLEYGDEVNIGNDVWIGGNTVINPGVTIGDNVVIGSGSVVTKDIPSNVVAAGNPCRVIRSITEADKAYWQNEKNLSLK